jgi:ABC-type glutathione transport system ATPase component
MIFKADIQKITLTDQKGTRTLLENLNFKIESGKIYTILGKNGSGKTTLIKSFTKLLSSSVYKVEGSAFWGNENIYQMDDSRLLNIRRNEIRYVLQDLTFNFDPLKKFKYYFEKSGSSSKSINEQLKSFFLPDYETISHLHPYEISGGMAQRLSLLFALLPNPRFIILDEPTSAVDYSNVNLIKLKLKEFVKNDGAVLIVTHDLGFAKEVSDQLAFLQDGILSDFKNSDDFFSNYNKTLYSNFIKSYNELR